MMKDKSSVHQMLSRRQVAALLDISITTLWREVRAGRFPRAVQISPGRVGWPAQCVQQWMDARAHETRGRVD